MAKAKWFSINKSASGVGRVTLLDYIGEGGVSAAAFDAELKALGKLTRLDIEISSGGGEVAQGFAIFNMLSRHPARKVVTINGIAASMASVIAMVGDEVLMPDNSLMMIHDPIGGIVGGPEEVASFADALDKMRDQIADAYVKRSGMSHDKALALMAKETWLTADEAVSLGLADRVIPAQQMAASVDISKFKRAPAAARDTASGKSKRPASWDDLARRAYSTWNSQKVREPEDQP